MVDPGGASPVDVVLVAGGRWHDIDHARAQLLTVLAGHDVARTRVFEDYAVPEVLSRAKALVTYTCDVRPDPEQQRALVDFVTRGGRWLALHGTNAAIDLPPPGGPRIFSTPDVFGPVGPLLGSRFLGHPPIAPYRVDVTDPEHPLVRGIGGFETCDELYVSRLHPPLHVLFATTAEVRCPGFAEADAVTAGQEPGEPVSRPVMYLRHTGAGTVCYLTLGHCRGRFDVRDLGVPDTGRRDLGSWTLPQFRRLLRRAVAWAVHGDAWTRCRAGAADLVPARLPDPASDRDSDCAPAQIPDHDDEPEER